MSSQPVVCSRRSTTRTGSVASQRFSNHISGTSLCTGSINDSFPSLTSLRMESETKAFEVEPMRKRVTEHANAKERIEAIARDYAAQPENTIIVSPDNRGRQLINQAVRTEMKANGTLAIDGQEFRTLVHRSDMTGADRSWAARYQP